MVQAVAAVAGHIQVFISIVVVVADGDAHAIANSLQAGLLRNVFKGPIRLLVVQAVPVFGAGLLRNESLGRWIGIRRAIHKEDIQQAVIVAIEKRHARTHGLNEILARGVRSLVKEFDPRLLGDIDKMPGCEAGGIVVVAPKVHWRREFELWREAIAMPHPEQDREPALNVAHCSKASGNHSYAKNLNNLAHVPRSVAS